VKSYILTVGEQLCPAVKVIIQDVSLFFRTHARRIQEQEQIYLNKLNMWYSLLIAIDSQPTTDNSQLILLIHGTDSALRVCEEITILCSLKCIETDDSTNVKK
jgi:hypothetical protein